MEGSRCPALDPSLWGEHSQGMFLQQPASLRPGGWELRLSRGQEDPLGVLPLLEPPSYLSSPPQGYLSACSPESKAHL